MKSMKVLHIASFQGNIGDNANHNGLRKRLKETLGCNIVFEELEMREFYQSWNMRDFNSQDFIDACNNSDLVVIGGGNFFELKWDYSCTGTTINMSGETIDKIKTPILFYGLGCDLAKGASDSTIQKFNLFLDKVTRNKRIFLSVRNDGSYDTILKLYGNKYCDRIHKVADGAFFMQTKKFFYPIPNRKCKFIGINVVSDMKEIRFNEKIKAHISYQEFLRKFARLLSNFLENNYDYQVVFFPHIYSDLAAIYELLTEINDQLRRTRILVAPYLTGMGTEEYFFGMYKECDLVMGMRFHSNVCSIAQNVPTIGLSSYQKINDLYNKELGLSDRVVEVNKYGFEALLEEKIASSLGELDKIKRNYQEINDKIYSENISFYQKVKQWYVENQT